MLRTIGRLKVWQEPMQVAQKPAYLARSFAVFHLGEKKTVLKKEYREKCAGMFHANISLLSLQKSNDRNITLTVAFIRLSSILRFFRFY